MGTSPTRTTIPVAPEVRDRIARLKRQEAAASDEEVSYNELLDRMAEQREELASLAGIYDF